MLVFDLGGSWWRVGLFTDERQVHLIRREPAVNRSSADRPVPVLQQELVDFVLRHTRAYLRERALLRVGISLGAAMNGQTGRVLASAPMWGPELAPFDLLAVLRDELPGLAWGVLNDVSALAVALRARMPAGGRKAAAVTVSSGIAYRTIDLRTGHIPLDPEHGLQGEIGHLPVDFVMEGRRVEAQCECGASGHLAAFSSGRGIEELLGVLPEAAWLRAGSDAPAGPVAAFGVAVRRGDPRALRLLDAFTRPLSRILLAQTTLDPEVGHTVLSGGVVDGLEGHYLSSLLRNLMADGLYGISHADPHYFRRRFAVGSPDGLDPLRGAGLHVAGLSSPPAQERLDRQGLTS
ncbi:MULTISPECIES: ROK family protein [unclassified Streptomyces]|uniref:ROK family protein n=1 Tax=unclassified Streptomyces TaxID=2593676 RepID=UPI001F51A08D|nr:ROK family protein [Streptomyces sp. TSRI0281]